MHEDGKFDRDMETQMLGTVKSGKKKSFSPDVPYVTLCRFDPNVRGSVVVARVDLHLCPCSTSLTKKSQSKIVVQRTRRMACRLLLSIRRRVFYSLR